MNFKQNVALVAALTASLAAAQEQRGTERVTVAGKAVTVEYGRPALVGRDMLKLAKPDVPWRMGAGSPTSLKADTNLSFGAVPLPKGSYILTAVKTVKDGKDVWSLIASDAEKGDPVATIPLDSTDLTTDIEVFTISLSGNTFSMSWGKKKLTSKPFTGT